MAFNISWGDPARRAYDHGFPFDPIVRSLLDIDFYKLLAQQFAWRNYPNTHAAFAVTNRTKTVLLVDEVDIDELREQLEYVKALKFQNNELVWLAGNTFYGQTGIFGAGYLDYLRHSFKLSDYSIDYEYDDDETKVDCHGDCAKTGQYKITFSGLWIETTLWEIYALTIVNELRYRKKMRAMSRAQLDIMYARAKVKLYAKLEKLNTLPELNLTDFGTRRRHSFLWQEYCVTMAAEVLGDKFTGTSNAYLAMKHGFEAKGSNPHEIPMTIAALAKTDEDLKQAQYRMLQQWQDDYRGNMLVFLPDTFGTTQFLADAPQWLNLWVGARPDSKKPIPGGEELITWWEDRMQEPTEKLIIFSDGLDVKIDGYDLNGEVICEIYDHFDGRVRMGFGFGTNFTNDFIGCDPLDPKSMKSISLVCKVETAEGNPAVKLSDVRSKRTSSDPKEVARYVRIFGEAGTEDGSQPNV
jgi:nicotinate phosphoribosyltransferase